MIVLTKHFARSIKAPGPMTKIVESVLVMAIVGGAILRYNG